MDGTREEPPGKVAENWGRKDHIRAGSVSGPWRSAPRAPAEGAGPAPVEAARRRAELRPRRGLGVAGWVSVGGVVAIGCVLAAFLLRPGEVAVPPVAMDDAALPAAIEDAVPPAVTKEAAAPPPAEPAGTEPPPADPALAQITGVRLRTGPDFPADRREAIVAALGAAGIGPVRVEALDIEVAASRVGYYRAADLPAAEALARLIAPVLAVEGSLAVRDYSQLLSDPRPGLLDLWIGRSGGA